MVTNSILAIFFGLIALKIVNAYIFATWIHRLTHIDHKIYHFLLGYGIQMAVFAILLFIGFVFNLSFANLKYLFLFGQIFMGVLGLINFRYIYAYKKIEFRSVLVTFLLMGVVLSSILIYFNFLSNEVTMNLAFLNKFDETSNIQTFYSKLIWESYFSENWGSKIVFFTFFQNQKESILKQASMFSYLEFSLLFALIFLNIYKSQIVNFKKWRVLIFIGWTFIAWIILFLTIIVDISVYWLIIFAFIAFLIIINQNTYKYTFYFWAFNSIALSSMFYTKTSFYWVLSTAVLTFIYFWKTKNIDYVFLLFSTIFAIMWSAVYLFYFSIKQTYLWLVPTLATTAGVLSLLTLIYLYIYYRKMLQKTLIKIHLFANKYTLWICLFVSFISMFFYGILLGVNNYKQVLLIFEQWNQFDNKINSFRSIMSIILWSWYGLVLLYFIGSLLIKKRKLRNFQFATGFTIVIVANPISYLIFIFATAFLTNANPNVNANLLENIFPFTTLIFINLICSFLLTKEYKHQIRFSLPKFPYVRSTN